MKARMGEFDPSGNRHCHGRVSTHPRPHGRRSRPRQGERRENGKAAETHGAPEERGDQAPRPRRGNACGDWEKLQCIGLDDFAVDVGGSVARF